MISERNKIIRAFVLTTVWILFFTVTLAGVMTAGTRTEKVMSGNRQTIICGDHLDKF